MNNKTKNLIIISIFVLGTVISQNGFSYNGGISGYSGNPATNAGNTCSTCHSGGVVPTVNLTGPATVQPGTISSFSLTISGGQQNSGGLDVSADGGSLINTLASTRLQAGEIIHNQRATAAGNGTVSWNFDWQAPTISGSYSIYGAGLSTNGNSNTTLDGVATKTFVVTVSSSAPQSPTAVILAPMTAQVNATVSIDGSASYDPDGTINQYEWNFGDGKTASGAQTTNSFSAAGTYTVTLVVTDSDNLTNSTFRDITAGGVMVPNANPGGSYTGIEGQAVNFDGSLSSHVEPVTSYIWDFGDGSVVEQYGIPTVSHTYAQPGAYTLTLAVQDANIITGVASTTVVIDATTPPTDGPMLYTNNCAACHGPLASSSKLNRSASQIQTAIDADIGGMGGLIGLTPTEVQAIADALVSTTPPPTDGPTLYTNNCAACHEPLATSSKLNSSASEIQAAIDANTGGMGGLSGLTPTEVQAIADALVSTTPPPTDGPTLYTNNCAACHEPLATSSKLNSSASEIQTAIDADTGGMGGLSGLTPTEVQAIADALVSTTPPPTDGPTLYTNNCAACHGPLATSSKLNSSASQIQAAIDANTGGMGGLSGLTPTEVQAIADALVSTTPPPTDGPTLYTNNCAACHGPLATSSKLNHSASEIQAAIDANIGGMGGLTGLTPTEVQAIADALISTTPPDSGQELYDSYCLVCHGPGGTGGIYGAVTGESASEITDAINEETSMNSTSLTSGQIQAIAGYLAGSTPPPPPVTGQALYDTYCLACHGPSGTGGAYEDVTGESASEIADAINEEPLMNAISLTSGQIQAIADYLSGSAPPPPPSSDGTALYTNNCSGCHGPLASSSKRDRSANQIQAAIDANIGGMGGLSSLTFSEVQSIANALAGGGTPAPTTGEQLYITLCQACHGLNGTGGSAKAVVGVSAHHIINAVSMIGAMQYIVLTGTDAQDIANFLSSGGGTQPPPTTGEEIYAIKCAACHGPGGNGGSEEAIIGASSSEIQKAMLEVTEMQSIPLSNGEAQALETYLSEEDHDDDDKGGMGGGGGHH